ncbi:response regulator transcription factor [Thermithiobacillus plumbiphilus]|uniref:Response regulator transcription factor n=1 Tax=Thermithiobacillus plumbiphilus TaxID=1729899 RepID=A0ABU9D9G8_9PROT
MPKPRILIIEDDPAMRMGLQDNLEVEGYLIESAATSKAGFESALQLGPDLIVLDLMLPDGNGLDLCRRMRAEGIESPIIMLTARGQEIDKVLGLEMGADDYVVKPFGLRELLARIHAQLRRYRPAPASNRNVRVGACEVDFVRQQMQRDNYPLEASAREFELLRYFVDHAGQVISRDVLLIEIWGHQREIVTRTVDNFILRLRKKIEPDPANPRYLLTIHGSGYKLVENHAEP